MLDEANYYVLGSANYGFNQYDTHRSITVPTVQQYLQANYTGSQIGANVEAGMKLSAGMFHLQPLVGLQYLYLCQQGFDETGGTAEMHVARTRANSLRASIGARLATDSFATRNGSLWTPFNHARFVGDLLDNDHIINASFSGAPIGGAFTTQGTRIGQVYGLIGQGVEVRLNSVWSLYAGAEATVGSRTLIGTGTLGAVSLW
jgi:outer membrane autotransporter protein